MFSYFLHLYKKENNIAYFRSRFLFVSLYFFEPFLVLHLFCYPSLSALVFGRLLLLPSLPPPSCCKYKYKHTHIYVIFYLYHSYFFLTSSAHSFFFLFRRSLFHSPDFPLFLLHWRGETEP
jgi:hypothetical protein